MFRCSDRKTGTCSEAGSVRGVMHLTLASGNPGLYAAVLYKWPVLRTGDRKQINTKDSYTEFTL